jgi:membrane protease YdiL (CAAX protease family)
MVNEVVVEDDELARLIPFQRTSFDDAVRAALEERGDRRDQDWGEKLRRNLPMSLRHQVPGHVDSHAVVRRRQRVVGATSLVSAALLGVGLTADPGSRRFFAATYATAAVDAVGAIASGPLHLGWIEQQDHSMRRPVLVPVATGAAAFGGFYGAARVARRIPPLRRWVASVLQYADQGRTSYVVGTALSNALAEELFFRGALYAAFEERPVARTTGVYVLATIPTRNPALVLAAAAMGTLWGMQRRATSGLQAPVLTHLTWSALMLRFMPPLFRERRRPDVL